MSTDTVVDAIVVGSGPSAVNAAYPLVEAGLTVRMLDVGNRDAKYAGLIPETKFSELRRTDRDQHRYFLGDDLEGIGFGHTGAGAQLTPPRQYVCKDTERLQPTSSESFFPLQSLAEGGLGGAWGAGSPPFSAADLAGFPIGLDDLQPHYEVVADRIGISGARDDLMPFLGPMFAMQPHVEVDSNGEGVFERGFGRTRRYDGFGVRLPVGLRLGGDDDGLSAETVANGVPGDNGFPLGRGGAGRHGGTSVWRLTLRRGSAKRRMSPAGQHG